MQNKSISVVIPNFNGKHLLEQNLPSVYKALHHQHLNFEIIIIDDCSNDQSVAFITQKYPEIKLIINDFNQGFSISCNKGIVASEKELILLLNTDINLSADYFVGQFKYFDKQDTFGVMSKIIGPTGEVQDTARYITRSGFKIKANNFYYVTNTNFWTPTAYLSGANALIDAKKLKEIGGFNEIFSPFYCEDFELGIRAWRLGWKCYYHPHSVCIHDHSSTTKNYKTKNWVKAIFFRNRLIVHAIHLETISLFLWHLQIIFTDFLFRWLGLRFFFYKSFWMYLNEKAQINASRVNLATLMKKYHSTKTVQDIALEMSVMLTGQTIIKGRN